MKAMPGLRPADCDRLTLAEIAFVLAGTEERTPAGRPSMSDDEILEYAARWQALTPQERLQHGWRELEGTGGGPGEAH